ncbi:MAG: hypothetical protein Q9207_005999 [Kuettlingeria erythrocarpa]
MSSLEKRDSDSGRSPSDDEKKVGIVAGGLESLGHGELPPDPDAGLSEEERARIVRIAREPDAPSFADNAQDRRLLWQLDLRLIPWLCLLYLISFLDRTNIGNARLAGLEDSLNITPGQFNAALSLFFVSYSLAEPLTNVLLKRLRPSIFIPAIMLLWGICMTLMGLCHNFGGLMAARFFLGLTEAGLFPGISYYLSCWYRRDEFGIRVAIFFSAAAVSGSFGGLLAAAIQNMDGIGGLRGWAWIFILEGIATVLVGIASFWMVFDFPDLATFLSDEDRQRVIRRLKADQQSSAEHEEFRMEYFWASVKDWKTWLGAVIYMGCDGPLYAFSLFLPTIINGLGYTSTRAQLLSVPPYAAAALLTVAIGYFADRTHQRGLCNIGVSVFGIIGFAMLLSAESPGVQYAGTFLGALGIYPCIANTITWVSNNTEGVYKRGVTLGFVIGWGNLNGVVSSNIYRAKDRSTGYKVGHGVVFAYLTLFLTCGSALQYVLLKRENAKRRAGEKDHLVAGKSEKEIEAMGDSRYVGRGCTKGHATLTSW